MIVQIGAAGYGAFYAAEHLKDEGDVFAHKGWEHGWNFHTGLGWLTVYGILIALVLALIARVGRPRIWWALGLAVAGVLQIVLRARRRGAPRRRCPASAERAGHRRPGGLDRRIRVAHGPSSRT